MVVAAVVLVGAGIAAGMSLGGVLLLALVAVAGATVVNLAGVALSDGLGARSLAVQVAVVAATAVAATAAGTLLTMALAATSNDHMRTLVVALGASAAAALVESFLLSVRVTDRAAAAGSTGNTSNHGAAGFEKLVRGPVESSQRNLVAWVAGDLRSPLRAISDVVDALEDGKGVGPSGAARHHAAIHHESERLIRLADDLYELSRGQGGELGVELAGIGLGELVADAVEALSPAASARGVRIEVMLESVSTQVAMPAPVVARVVRVLLDDAVGHAANGTLVQVETATDGDAVVLSVRDNCGGFAGEEPNRVFDVAFVDGGDDPILTVEEGHGLTSVRRLVQGQGGQLLVERLTDGCRITVRLPLPQ